MNSSYTLTIVNQYMDTSITRAIIIYTLHKLRWQLSDIHQALTLNIINANTESERIAIKFTSNRIIIESSILGNYAYNTEINKSNCDSFDNTYHTIINTKSTEGWQRFLLEFMLQHGYKITDGQIVKQKSKTWWQDFTDLLILSSYNFSSFWIIIILVVIFILLKSISASIWNGIDIKDLIYYGANYTPYTAHGEYWRLFTCNWIHFDASHLASNISALFIVGALASKLVSKWEFLFIYILLGICASACSLWYHDVTVSAGASGAVFGMYGFLIGLLPHSKVHSNHRIALFVFLCMYIGWGFSQFYDHSIDTAAHFGGLISGIFLGLVYTSMKNKSLFRFFIYIVFTIILVSLVLFVTYLRPYRVI